MRDIFNKYYAEITGLIVFIVYIFTLAPSVIQIDSGELAAVQATLGIAHPTGYPLFTLLGYFFLQLPLPFTDIYQVNLLSAIFTAASVTIYIKTAYLLLQNFKPGIKQVPKKNIKKQKGENSKSSSLDDSVLIFFAVLSGLTLAFSKTFWFQSTSVEVYSLHLLLITISLYLLLNAYFHGSTQDDLKGWIYFSIALAFSFSNHLTTILILPLTAYLFFDKNRFRIASFKKIGIMLLIFFPVLILNYIYLPVRASFNPLLNWGNPDNWERFMRHFSGAQYQVWLFSSFDSAKKQLTYFLTNLPSEFAYIGLIFGLAGIGFLITKSKKILLIIGILFLSVVFYSINYDIVDIDAYFLLAYISLSLFITFGFYAVYKFLSERNIRSNYILPIFFTLAFIQLVVNYSKVDQSGIYTYEDYTKSLLNSTEPNSIVFSYQWDYFISAAYYFQYAEEFRNDVVIIDKELLRRSWYYNQLDNNYPELFYGVENEINSFLEALAHFERSENFDANRLETLYREIMKKLISENIDEHDYYIGPELVANELRNGEFILPEGKRIVPHLFLYKVVFTDDYVDAPLPTFKIRFPKRGNKYTDFIADLVVGMLSNRAAYEMQFDKKERAKLYVNKIKEDFPQITLSPQLQKILEND
ncbi:MAG: DUF2723 domain-containing protein [Melioribacteraceae bacterium]|nr:DUF2723 domain-containing protein [Melioribacteraceae bacterium]MCF8393306.1 DUF2723 domain-containing protein [Melioribacteraceae bacterium]MCF8419158.1 DUF2723 domain-containing protein [Melioribacteraceae bacterium]